MWYTKRKEGLIGAPKKEINSQIFLLHVIAQGTIHFLTIASIIKGNVDVMAIAIFVAIIYAVVAEPEEVFYLIVGLSPYQYVFKLYGNNASFLLTVIFLFKLWKRNRYNLTKSMLCFVCAGVLLSIEIVNDASLSSKGEWLVNICYLSFFLYIISNLETLHFDVIDFLAHYSIAFIFCTICIFYCSGGLFDYLNVFLEEPTLNRFGEIIKLEVGGAMGVPLYALILISISIFFLFTRECIEKVYRFVLYGLIVYAVVIGLLTVSKSFLLGLAAIVVLNLLNIFLTDSKKALRVCFIAALLIVGIYLIAPVFWNGIFGAFINRMVNGTPGGTGRAWIWGDCFTHLTENWQNFMFGGGASEYVLWGPGDGFTVSAGAHNLLLDVCMSWGLLGFIAFMCLLIKVFLPVCFRENRLRWRALIPAITFFVFSFTALRTTQLTSYAFLLTTILIWVSNNSTKTNKNDMV